MVPSHPISGAESPVVESPPAQLLPTHSPVRLYAFIGFLIGLTGLFAPQLWQHFSAAYQSGLNSYIVLIPFAALYLLASDRGRLPREYQSSPGWAILPLLLGVTTLLLGKLWQHGLSANDRSSLIAATYVCFLWTGILIFLGRRWFAAAAFPVLFLVFLIPLPDIAVEGMENGLQVASAEAANAFFALTGMPALREGKVFHLPNITIQVAQECSGIRSSWILLITSLVAAHLFLTKPWSRFVLVAVVIPLGILRNGFRIMVIGTLCVRIGPHMIDSPLHRRGGPLFFILSLIPFAIVLWLLRRFESRRLAAGG